MALYKVTGGYLVLSISQEEFNIYEGLPSIGQILEEALTLLGPNFIHDVKPEKLLAERHQWVDDKHWLAIKELKTVKGLA